MAKPTSTPLPNHSYRDAQGQMVILTKPHNHSAKNSAKWLSKVVVPRTISSRYIAANMLRVVKLFGRGLRPIKKGLRSDGIPVYGYYAPAEPGAGIGVLITCIVPTRTKRVFLSAKFLHTQIMVGWMRLPKGRPVSIQAGYANLVQLTTSLRLASHGGEFTIHCIEAATMATTPTQNLQFIWIIAAIRRDIESVTVKIFHVTAVSEREARRTLVRDHVCFFAGRIRLTEVDHA